MTESTPKPVLVPRARLTATSQIERNAYAAAHAILALSMEHGEKDLACRGARRSRTVNRIAAAIAREFGEELKP